MNSSLLSGMGGCERSCRSFEWGHRTVAFNGLEGRQDQIAMVSPDPYPGFTFRPTSYLSTDLE
jgi:hypothetical protein